MDDLENAKDKIYNISREQEKTFLVICPDYI